MWKLLFTFIHTHTHTHTRTHCKATNTATILAILFTCIHTCTHAYAHRPAAKEPLQNPGTVLLLSVFNHDLFGPNTLCGICVVPCTDIPFLSPVSSAFDNPNATERKNLMLPLFQITESTIALKELRMRANSQAPDPKASEFLKTNKQILATVELKNTAHS